ncbi:MAG: TonB family protein [Bradymonadaceae bacterium]
MDTSSLALDKQLYTFFDDPTSLRYLTISAAVHILFLLLIMSMPDASMNLELDGFSAQDRFVQLLLQPEQEIEEPTSQWLSDNTQAAAGHVGEEGKAGKEEAEKVDKKMAVAGPTENTDIELEKERDIEIATNAGALALFQDEMSNPWAAGEQTVGADALSALGAMTGEEAGDSWGQRGLGIREGRRGGPGESDRSIGMDRVGTTTGVGGDRPLPEPELDRDPIRIPEVIPGPLESTGGLDREIIQRVVRQHRREIQYCYEQELQRHRELAGRVTIRFTVAATGSVISATVSDSSMNSPNLDRCMTDRIRRWVFPEPTGGGIVIVNYPFNFRS